MGQPAKVDRLAVGVITGVMAPRGRRRRPQRAGASFTKIQAMGAFALTRPPSLTNSCWG